MDNIINNMNKQQLPKWFKGEIYKDGATVYNRFSGEEYELMLSYLCMIL